MGIKNAYSRRAPVEQKLLLSGNIAGRNTYLIDYCLWMVQKKYLSSCSQVRKCLVGSLVKRSGRGEEGLYIYPT
jgi:hypothetical protein